MKTESEQFFLPFSNFQFPKEHARLMAVANAAKGGMDTYSPFWRDTWKHVFYSLKTKILKEHAVPDGFDLQFLELKCRSCYLGVWHSEYSDRTGVCWHCDGTGIFRRDCVKLTRWNLAGRIFHYPSDRVQGWKESEIAEWKSGAVNSINGKIVHIETDEKDAISAFLVLLRAYDKLRYEALIDRRIRERLEELRKWGLRPINNIYIRVRSFLRYSESRFAEGLREWFGIFDDVPF